MKSTITRPRTIAALALAAGAACLSPAAAAAAPSPSAPVSTGHSQWAWGSPTPQGNDLSAVTFRGADGYAVGQFGTILRSDDSGASWTGLPSGTTEDLDLVQELDRSTVIAAGGCSAVESTNGGASFRSLPLGLGSDCDTPVTGVAFTDAQHGYVELQDGTLFYTSDGGASLESRSAPALGGGDAHATGLAFSSPSTGLAVSDRGLIDRTTDGGNSWSQVKSASKGLAGVTIVTPTLAYAVGDSGELLRSTDGGENWTSLPLRLQDGGAVPDLTSITCADEENCLIATAMSNVLVRTTDGGQTATKVSVSNGALSGVAYAAGTTGVGVGGGGATVISHDAGRTFPTVTTGGLSHFKNANQTILPGLAPGNAYLPGEDGQIAATTDSGRSWSLLRVPTRERLDSVAFTSRRVGYVLDDNGVLRRTANAGRSWSALAQGHSPRSRLLAPTPRSLLLVGPRGVFRSAQGGSGFHKVRGRLRVGRRLGPTVASLRLDSGLASHGVAVAWSMRSRKVIVSADGGRNWRSIPMPPFVGHGYLSVSAMSRSRLWVLGSSGILWSTRNAGRHWDAVSGLGAIGNGKTYAGDVSFSSPRDGVVSIDAADAVDGSAFGAADVLRTTNGGRTWTPEIIGGGNNSDALAMPSGDIALQNVESASDTDGLFTTAGTQAPARHTSLRVRFARPRLSARALAHAGHRVLVTGRVTPVLSPDEQVAVSYRLPGHVWKVVPARVAGNGVFRYSLRGVRTTAQVVAQALGTSAVAGAGTPVARFHVSR